MRPEEERPGVFVAQAVPDELRPRRGFTETDLPGLLYQEEEALYAAYGTMGDAQDAAFYPADAAGTVEAGALPLARICAVPAYTPGDRPKQEGYLKLVVYIPTQSVVAYRAIDNEWIIERVMACSSGRSRNITPRGTFGIQVKYPLKRLGTPGDYCYGQYACRFTGPFLFHSVPISYDADNDVTLARRMMFMEKYEQLGTPASDGCIRLTVADAKWIFDNSVIYDTRVVLTDDAGPIPPTPPPVIWEAPYTDENGLGWDPTDPDPDNPYLRHARRRPPRSSARGSPGDRPAARAGARGRPGTAGRKKWFPICGFSCIIHRLSIFPASLGRDGNRGEGRWTFGTWRSSRTWTMARRRWWTSCCATPARCAAANWAASA